MVDSSHWNYEQQYDIELQKLIGEKKTRRFAELGQKQNEINYDVVEDQDGRKWLFGNSNLRVKAWQEEISCQQIIWSNCNRWNVEIISKAS